MTNPDPNDFLMGTGGAPVASFKTIGETWTGQITEEPRISQQRDMQTGKPQFYEDGNPKLQLIITMQTTARDATIKDDDGKRRIFVNKPSMRQAIADAVRASGRDRLEIGGTLTVQYTHDGEAQRGFNPPKQFAASYVPPAQQQAFLQTAPTVQQGPAYAAPVPTVTPTLPPGAVAIDPATGQPIYYHQTPQVQTYGSAQTVTTGQPIVTTTTSTAPPSAHFSAEQLAAMAAAGVDVSKFTGAPA